MKITKETLKQMIAEEASILQEAFGARSTGMDSMFIGQSGDSGGRSYMSFEDKQEVIDKLRAALEEEGADYLFNEDSFTDAIEEIGYEAGNQAEFLSGIVDYLNSEEFRTQQGYGQGFGDGLNLKEEKGLKAKIRKAHKEEGGAAGMDALEKHTKASAKDIKAAVKDMDDVGQHKDGDYIQGDGKEIQIAKEQVSEVFQSGLHTMEPSKALEYYQETLKDYRVVAGKIQQMLPEEQKMGEGEEAVNITEVAIEEMMKLVEFALENKGMSQQQKDEVLEKAEDLNYEGEAVLKVLKIVRETPEELEDLVRELHKKYQVAEEYLRGILDPEYTGIDPTDADFEDAGKQMGLGLQEQKDPEMISQARLDGTLDAQDAGNRGDKWEGGPYFDEYEDAYYIAQEEEDRQDYYDDLDERIKENKEYDGEACEDTRDEYKSAMRRIYKLEAEVRGYEDYSLDSSLAGVAMAESELERMQRYAKKLKEKKPQCFDKEYVIPLTPDEEREKRFMDTGDFGEIYKESKKDLLKRIVAEELAKMEIEAMEASGELDEITYSGDGIDFSDKEGIRTSDDDMSVRGILGRMGSDSVEGRLAKAEMDKFLARHQGRAEKRIKNKRDQFSSVKDAEERRLIDAARERSKKTAEKIQAIRNSMKDRDLTGEEAVYIMSIDGSDDLKDYNDDAVQPRDKIGS